MPQASGSNIQNCKIEEKKNAFEIKSPSIKNDLNFEKLYFKHDIFYNQVLGRAISCHGVKSMFLARV